MEEIDSDQLSEKDTRSTKENKKYKSGETIWSVRSFIKHPVLVILSLMFLGLIIHPKLLNIHRYFKLTSEPIPMNYVSNFFLWTRHNPQHPEKLVAGDLSELEGSSFQSQKTYFIIHGFTRNGLDNWIIRMKNALLWREPCNVISVDWEAGSVSAGYYVIQARVPLVGEDVAKFVTFLQQKTLMKPKDVHLIGHSLGAHIAGFTGKYLNGTLQRITGLDPASLGYNGAGVESRLDKSDAIFVDVIHTHGCYTIMNQWTDCFGTYDNIGDADFWPNGGENQPACDETGDGARFVREGSNCNHGMAYVYFIESVRHYSTTTRYLARECSSYQEFNNGTCPCGSPPQYMGYNVNPRITGVFYLNTSKHMPFGKLEPSCSPAEYSLFRIIGVTACFLLVLVGFMYSSLSLVSLCGHEKSVRNMRTIFAHINFPFPNKVRTE